MKKKELGFKIILRAIHVTQYVLIDLVLIDLYIQVAQPLQLLRQIFNQIKERLLTSLVFNININQTLEGSAENLSGETTELNSILLADLF